ncbi:MAG: hypothetical protein AMK70_09435 [Nitrospira bacterium SG8_35_1]|nr:MAG: hypothetical protein AMK70_09435 [Nitrospira bacterium SG8_35_1]
MDKRTILAVALSVMVLVVWSFFAPKKPVQEPQAPVASGPAVQSAPPVRNDLQESPAAPAPVAAATAAMPAVESAEAKDIVIETDLYKAVFSTQGAIIKSWELKKYKDNNGMPVALLKKPGIIPALGIMLEDSRRNLPQQSLYTASAERLVLSEGRKKEGEVLFTLSRDGMLIRKRFVFYNDHYKVDLSVETSNTPEFSVPLGTGFGIFDTNGGSRTHSGPVVLIDDDRQEFKAGDDPKFLTGVISWIAQEDSYFTAALIPLSATEGVSVWNEGTSAEISLKMKPQKNDFIFYAGPKEYDRLKALNKKLEHLVDFGWFAFVAMPLFWVLKYFYSFTGNYGWSIILLTIVTRVPFIPIMAKSQKSMKKMQKVQPLMAELKEKYKNDAAKLQKETMELYKKHKVNPIGGCLPMFLQIPVFIALFNVLQKAIELRGAPWIFWITDLSVKDPYYVMPIVMGLTMVLQQKMTPSAMDPKQAKMMMLMPIVFTFMFLSFASGLVLYWLVNNILGIAQQFHTNRKAD